MRLHRWLSHWAGLTADLHLSAPGSVWYICNAHVCAKAPSTSAPAARPGRDTGC